MFQVNDSIILTDPIEILQELKNQLAINGVQLFTKFKISSDNIMTNCPIHNNGQEKKPSCGISKSGQVHCFTCGYSTTIQEMISNVFGYDDWGNFGSKWLIKNFLRVSIQDRKAVKLNISRNKKHQIVNYITEEELDSYRYIHQYMYQRKLTDKIIEDYDVGYDKQTNCLTFPVKDIEGNCLFIARRSVKHKFFHYPQGVQKPVYGIYELKQFGNWDTKEVIICESIINALTCIVYGSLALALLGLGTKYQCDELKKLPFRHYVLAFDSDKAGMEASERFKKNMMSNKLITKLNIPKNKDVNDLSFEEFKNLSSFF